MIEKFTEEELSAVLNELRGRGYEITINTKGKILRSEAEKLGMRNPFISQCISSAIFDIADWATENTYKKQPKNGGVSRKYKYKNVSVDRLEEYRRICGGILELIKPYWGRLGFKEKGVYNEQGGINWQTDI